MENDIFAIRTTNEQQTDFIITVGNHLATKKHFKSREEAEQYLSEKHWDVLLAVMAETIEVYDRAKREPIVLNKEKNNK